NRSFQFRVDGGVMADGRVKDHGYVVLCDDLTGSSVQSIQLKSRGFSPVQKIRHEGPDPSRKEGYPPIMVVNINTRMSTPEVARERVRSAVLSADPQDRFAKRIDTTLRGHLYDETSILLEMKPDTVALVVPAYPASGRTTIGGYQLLNGSLLEETEVGRDPTWPISTSYLPSFFNGNFPLSCIAIDHVNSGFHEISRRLLDQSGYSRIIIVDAQSDEDIETIAKAAASIPVSFIPVDPGPFTASYLFHLFSGKRRGVVLALVGSVSDITMEQLRYLENRFNVTYFFFTIGEEPQDILARCRKMIDELKGKGTDVLVARPSGNVVRGREKEVVKNLAKIGSHSLVWMDQEVSGIILSGGDTAIGFFEHIGAWFLEPEIEIAPLMMGGLIKGTVFDGMRVVTKGGLIGGHDGLYRAVKWIREGESK
ncbi:MAG: four-carbon acid sugar kinase family protein, partial [Synergistaceae bacterium]|nr:four-carbon acid sugar kinase family protein [Synergistaceae bacterium]